MATPMTSTPRELVLVSVADSLYAIDIMQVREIRGWTGSTSMPNVPSYILGIFNLRGTALAIMDLATRLGGGMTNVDRSSVIIVVEINGRLVGLLVDAVCDIITATADQIQDPPGVGEGTVHLFVEGVMSTRDSIIKLLRTNSLLPAEEGWAA